MFVINLFRRASDLEVLRCVSRNYLELEFGVELKSFEKQIDKVVRDGDYKCKKT